MLQSRAWFNLITYRRFLEVIVESAAIYSTASLALVVTCFISPNVGFGACLSVFPQIIVRPNLTLAVPAYTVYSLSDHPHPDVPMLFLGSDVLAHSDPDCVQHGCDE